MRDLLVSAICCTHNRPLFVRKAIELFKAQTWPRKELIIMDDGPEGSVPEISDPEVRHVRIPSYTWITHKHRMAFPLCQGELLAYWDDDDWYSPRRLALQAQAISEGRADVCGFHVKAIASVPD
ncbi:MAG TPA: glycosyltransferase, partial [Planctomycetota bacterium]|nr:glycosyltransferase [Planctomycetota bacterium]